MLDKAGRICLGRGYIKAPFLYEKLSRERGEPSQPSQLWRAFLYQKGLTSLPGPTANACALIISP